MNEQNLFMKNNPLLPDNNITEMDNQVPVQQQSIQKQELLSKWEKDAKGNWRPKQFIGAPDPKPITFDLHGNVDRGQPYTLKEKSTSIAQQQAAGIAHAVEKGDLPKSKLWGASKKMFDSMSSKELDKFASTKHKGLPKHVEEKEIKENTSPTMNENNIQELSTGLMNKAADIASAKQGYSSTDPLTAQRKGWQADKMSSYINPEVQQAFTAIGGSVFKRGEAVVVNIGAGGNEYVQFKILPDGYEVTHGNLAGIPMNVQPKLQRAIQKAQADLKTPRTQPPAENELEENMDTQTPITTAKAEQNPVTAQGNVVVQEMPTGNSVFATKPMWKNMMESMNVPSTPEPTEECSTPKKKKYRFTEEQVKMIKEIQVLKENMNKLENGKKLLF